MHWVFLAHGDCTLVPRLRALIDSADCIVGVDGGCAHLEPLGIIPHIAIGDMDSIPPELLEAYHKNGVHLHLHPPKKNATDLELALELAFASGVSRITLIGATGGRLDHTLGNLFLLSRCLEYGVVACAADASQTIHLTDADLNLHGNVGDILSLMPVTSEVHGVTLSGLEYPLHDASIPFGSTWGMSNVFTVPQASVKLRSGRLLVFHLHTA